MNAVSVPNEISVFMFAERARACCTAPTRNGHPAMNCTGMVAANASHPAHGYAPKNIVKPEASRPNGHANQARRDQKRIPLRACSLGDS